MPGKSNLITKNEDGMEQIVWAEVLIPDTPNCYGDVFTVDSIREFAYAFMVSGMNGNVINDIEHDNIDVTGKVYVIESFVARANDPDFYPGSWVIGMKVVDPVIWRQIMDNELNGFSFEAAVGMVPVHVENLRSRLVTGITAPDPVDGHTHSYAVIVDCRNYPISGETSETDGHKHGISRHTVTDLVDGHRHRFDVLNFDGE